MPTWGTSSVCCGATEVKINFCKQLTNFMLSCREYHDHLINELFRNKEILF